MKVSILLTILYYTQGIYGNSGQHPKSFQGDPMKLQEHPSLTHLVVKLNRYVRNCDGTILNERFILTSGSCLDGDIKFISVIIRGPNISGMSISNYNVSNRYPHPNHIPGEATYDIGLVEVEPPMMLVNGQARPVEMADVNSTVTVGEEITVLGWNKVNAIHLPVIDLERCQEQYMHRNESVTDLSFCASSPIDGQGSCVGGPGAPAMTSNGIQVGIMSISLGCLGPNYPSVFTNVALLRDWIKLKAGA